MPIDVTCDECFTPHRVKSEHAGRRFKCRECGASLVVPKKGQAPAPAAPPPATGRSSKSVSKTKAKKRRSASKSRGPAWAKGPLAWIAGGLGLLVLILLLVFPPFLGLLAMPLALAGIAMALWGALKCLASAFEEDVACGLMWLFVPLYNVFYMFTRWDRVGPYFLAFLAGLFLMWAPLYGFKMVMEAQRAERNRDPNSEIAEQYDDSALDAQIDQFQQSAPAGGTAAGSPVAGNTGAATPDRTPTAGALASRSNDGGAGGRSVPRRPGRQPPPASVLDGRPDPLPSPPRAAEIVIHTTSPAHPGDPVWVDDKGWWYSGTVTELTENPFHVMVRFAGWDDRDPVEINTARLRHRTQMSDEVVTYKLKIVSIDGPTDQLDQRVDEKLSSAYGYVPASAHVDLENYLITYRVHPGSDLENTLSATSSLISLGIDSRGMGIVKEVAPLGEMMIGQVHYTDYREKLPLQQFADRALRGYRQYVPGSAQVDEQAGVIRFVFDASVVEESYHDYTSLQQLFAALGYTANDFGQLSNPQATPYKKQE